MREQCALLIRCKLVHALRHGFGGGIAKRDLDQRRRVEQLIGELLDLVRESRRKEQVLALGRGGKQCHDPLDVRNETHVQHAIGLVENEDLDLAQVHGFLLDVVQKTSWRGHQYLDACAHDRQLLPDVDPAIDDRGANPGVFAVGLHRFLDLDGQLARGCQDQGTDRMASGRWARVGKRQELLQNREGKSGGLAGAGLGAAHDIEALQYGRDRLRLNRRGCGVASFGDGAEQLRPQAEFVETRGTTHLYFCSWRGPPALIAGSGPGSEHAG